MNYNKILSSLFCLLLTMSLPSCTDWLDVQEKTSVEEKDLFTTYMGFKTLWLNAMPHWPALRCMVRI